MKAFMTTDQNGITVHVSTYTESDARQNGQAPLP